MEHPAALSEGLERPVKSAPVIGRTAGTAARDSTFSRKILKAEQELDLREASGRCLLWQKKHRRHNSGFGKYLGNRRVLTVETRVSRLPIAGVRRGAAV
jgi:hypothetical protein